MRRPLRIAAAVIALLVLAFVVDAFFPLGGAVTAIVGDSLTWRLRWASEFGAVDCGRADRHNPHDATTCAIDAWRRGKPFRVRYELQGIDSEVAVGLVGTSRGTLRIFDFDGNPYGGGRTLLFGQRTWELKCPASDARRAVLYVSGNFRASCRLASPFPTRDIMSPTWQPY